MPSQRLLAVGAVIMVLFTTAFGQENETETNATECACANGVCSRSAQGSVTCICDHNWEGDFCNETIDLCAQEPCQDVNAECQTSDAGRRCSCKQGFEPGGDGMCVKSLMWMGFMNFNSPTHVEDLDHLPGTTFASGYPFPCFNVSSLFVAVEKRGFIYIGRFTHSLVRAPDFFDPFEKTNWPAFPFFLAPYWTELEYDYDSDDSNVYNAEDFRHSNLREESPLLDYADSVMENVDVNFKPLAAYAFTWYRARPKHTTEMSSERATVQVILVTDSIYTYAIINWHDLFSNAHYAGGPEVVSGHSGPDGGFIPLVPEPRTQKVVALFSSGAPTLAPLECMNKIRDARANVDFSAWVQIDCPCIEKDAKLDFRLLFAAASSTNERRCYHTLYFTGGMKTQCCYDQHGVPISGSPDGPSPIEEHSAQEPTIQSARDFCCSVSSVWCSRAYTVGNCDTTPTNKVAAAGGYGSLHLNGFRGNAYTFNGWGEYILASSRTIEVQGRSERRGTGNTTYFSAYALKPAVNTSSYQFYLSSEGNLEHGWTGDSPVDPGMFLLDDSDSDSVTFTMLHFQLMVKKAEGDSLALTLTLPGSAWVNGLLGIDNQLKPLTALGAEDWRVSKDNSLFDYTKPAQTTYEAQNDHAGFEPEVLSQNVTEILDMIAETERSQAEDLCGTELFCLQEFYLFQDADSAASSALTRSQQLKELVNDLNTIRPQFGELPTDQFAPNNITAGFSVELALTSPSIDQVTFTMEGSFAEVENISIDSNTLRFLASNLSTLRALTYPQSLTFLATDQATNLTRAFSPRLYFCLCEEDAQCLAYSFDYVDRDGDINGNVVLVGCKCDLHKGGRFCEQEMDICTNCYNETTCDPSKTDGYCDNTCPAPLEGNGILCREVDYCATNNGGCDQKCENMDLGPLCSCNAGYLVNGSKCIDTNECADNPTICNNTRQYCFNTPGSYECKCFGNGLGENCIVAPYMYPGSVQLAPVGEQRWSSINGADSDTSELRNKIAQSLKTKLTEDTTSLGLGSSGDLFVEVTGFNQINSRSRRSVDRDPEVEAAFVINSPSRLDKARINSALELPDCEANCDLAGLLVYSSPVIDSNTDLCSIDSVNTCDEHTSMCSGTSDDLIICKCLSGFAQTADPNICQDINECETDANKCASRLCTNTYGSYTCQCESGFYWNSVSESCMADACQPNPCKEDWLCYVVGNTDGYTCSPSSGALDDDDSDRWKTAVIVISVVLGFLCICLIIAVVVLTLRRRKTLEMDAYSNSRYNDLAGGDPRQRAYAKRTSSTEMTEQAKNRNIYDNPSRNNGNYTDAYSNSGYSSDRM